MQPDTDLGEAGKQFDGPKLRLKKKGLQRGFFILVSSPQTKVENKDLHKSQMNSLSEPYINFPKLGKV